jgi:hypothetical protein
LLSSIPKVVYGQCHRQWCQYKCRKNASKLRARMATTYYYAQVMNPMTLWY